MAFGLIAVGIVLARMIFPQSEKGIIVFGAISILACVVAILTASFSKGKIKLAAFITIVIGLISFGGYRYELWSRIPESDVSRLNGREVRLYGAITSDIELSEDRQRFELSADSVEIQDTMVIAIGKIRIYLYQARPLAYGDYIAINVKLQEPWRATNPYAYDFKKSLESKGIRSIAFVYRDRNVRLLDSSGGSFFLSDIVNPLRRHIEKTIDANLHGDSAALLKGLMLGLGRKLPDDVRDAFADSGTVHILAVSGLHVGIIAGLAWLLFASIIRIPRGISAVMTIVLLAVFAGLVGGRPSVLRAAFMFSIIIVGASLNKPPNLLNSIGAAGAVLLAIKPIWIGDIGFQLSFGATLGIAYLLPKFQSWLPEKYQKANFAGTWIISPFLVSLSATLGTAPLVAWHFHRFQLIGPIANLVVLPPLGIIIGYGILAVIFQPILPFLTKLFLAVDWLFLRIYLLNAVKFFASLPFAYLTFPHPSFTWVVFYYVVLVASPVLLQKLNRKYLAAIGYIAITALALLLGRITSVERLDEDIRVTFFDIGQGDCALIEFDDGREMLIDGGQPGNVDFSVVPYLQARGLKRIDAVVMTHSDADHVGGLRDLQNDFEYGTIYVPYATYTSNLHRRFIEYADSLGTLVELLSLSEHIHDFPELEVLWPDTLSVSPEGSLLVNANEGSIVLMLKSGEAEVFFAGDIGIPTERSIVELADIECDVVKVPHHGSKYSTAEEMVKETTPLLAVISVGAKNRFGHPADRVIEDYRKAGSEVLRTDKHGAVILSIDKGKIKYRSYLGKSGVFNATDQPHQTNVE